MKFSWTAFAVLCAVAGSRWVLADNFPELGSTLRTEAWACGVGVVGCGLVALVRRRPLRWRQVWGVMAVGVGLLAMPALGAALRGAAGEQFDRTIALCLVPIVAVVLGEGQRFWPGLAGMGGALLVFPLERPEGVWGYVGLAVVPVAVGAACAGSARVVRDVAAEWSAAGLFAGGAVGLVVIEVGRAVSSGAGAQRFSAGAVGLDAVVAGLVVLVVLRMDGVRYAARYFVVPLVTLVEGVALFHGGFTLRTGLGMVMLGIGAVGLMVGKTDGQASLRFGV